MKKGVMTLNIVNNFEEDEKYQRLMQFAKNKKPHGGLSNLYLIQKKDINGNLIDEYYGMNIMTDYGMSQYFVNNDTFPKNIYIGNGTGTFNHTTSELLSPITTTASTVSNQTIAYNYPLYYDEDSKLITCICRYLVAYFDYNIANITDKISVSEYGIGTAVNKLWTHSWVYDKQGNQTYITKDVNERLEITVYMCMSYYESLITQGYEDGRYTIITSMRRFFENRMDENNIYTYKRYSTGSSRTKTNTSSGFMNNEITRITNLVWFDMENKADSSSGYIDGFCQWTSGFMVLEPQQLDEPEDFDITIFPLNDSTSVLNDKCLSDTFGHVDHVPFTQADIESVALYNMKTGKYDNYEEFYNNAEHCYCETPMQTYFATPIYYTNNNTKMLMYVFQNVRTDDPIIGLENNDLSTVYVTNKYWDTSSWTLITDFNNIPESLQTARYWITPSNENSLKPIRRSGHFHIIPNHGGVEQLSFGLSRYINAVCDNYDYGWYMMNNVVYCPSISKTYTIGTGSTNNALMTYDKWLVVFNSSTNYIVADMSDLSAGPVTTTMTPLFTKSTNVISYCHRSETTTGIICLQSLSANEATVLDLRGNTPTQTLLNSSKATCVWGKNQIAYIPANDSTKIIVHDYDVNGDVREFNIPSELSSATCMFAHRDYVWLTDGATYTHMFNINTGSSTPCSNTIKIDSSISSLTMTAVNEALVLYRHAYINTNDAYYVKYDDPTNPGSLSLFDESPSRRESRINYTLRYIHDNTLMLLISHGYGNGSYNIVADFGQFLNDDTKVVHTKYTTDTFANYTPFGEFIIYDDHKKVPAEYFLPHRIIGKTKTITALNNIKSISSKTWMTTITNIPEFIGLPPGEVQ